MKYLYLFALVSVISFSSVAQSKEYKSVINAVEKLRAAMISGERAALEAIASDSVSYGHSGGNVQNKAEFVEGIASGKSDFVTIDLSEQTVSVMNNVAVVRHVLTATTNDGGKPGNVKIKVLLVWVKEKGKWKMLARQAVKLT
ncbi:MAG: nuclear transport factor 2 family protein [Bacteroidota bacterium]